jgi:hypothetical protein
MGDKIDDGYAESTHGLLILGAPPASACGPTAAVRACCAAPGNSTITDKTNAAITTSSRLKMTSPRWAHPGKWAHPNAPEKCPWPVEGRGPVQSTWAPKPERNARETPELRHIVKRRSSLRLRA